MLVFYSKYVLMSNIDLYFLLVRGYFNAYWIVGSDGNPLGVDVSNTECDEMIAIVLLTSSDQCGLPRS